MLFRSVCDVLQKPSSEQLKNDKTQSHHPSKKYNFDITRADMIFDWLVKEKKVKLTHELPPNEELKTKIYCKWHGKWTHNTNNCTHLGKLFKSGSKMGF